MTKIYLYSIIYLIVHFEGEIMSEITSSILDRTTYTATQINFILSLREKQITWENVAVKFNSRFKVLKSGNALRKTINRLFF